MITKNRLYSGGFTILELLIAMTITGFLATALMAVSITYYGDTVRSHQTASLGIEAQYVLHAVIEDIRLADQIAPTTTITDPSNGTWTTSDTNNVLVLSTPATTSDHDIIYDSSTGYPYSNELVYFINNGTLYKRTLKNASALNNAATTSCPSASATSTCPADKQYTDNIDDMTFEYYDQSNAVTTDPSLAYSVKVTISMSRKVFGQTITFNNTLQTTLRNRQ